MNSREQKTTMPIAESLSATTAVQAAIAAPRKGSAQIMRWAYMNLSQRDLRTCDPEWWRTYWKSMAVQGVIIPAGGTAAYYPSKIPFHQAAPFVSGRDIYGELAKAAKEEGLVVLARVDSGPFDEEVLRGHPEWVARDIKNDPVRIGKLYAGCTNGGYFEEFIPAVIGEIVARYGPDGFVGHGWSGLGRDQICQCANCVQRFRAATGEVLPASVDWNSVVYRKWVRWSYARRLEAWKANDRVAQEAGGHECRWVGVVSSTQALQAKNFQDVHELARLAPFLVVENNSPTQAGRFRATLVAGNYLNNLAHGKSIVLITPLYHVGKERFPLAGAETAECRLAVLAGSAGGMLPALENGGVPTDARAAQIGLPLLEWHQANERYLNGRTAVARIGVIWSQPSADFYGRAQPDLLADAPYRGMVHALMNAKLAFKALPSEDMERKISALSVLVLPNIAAMSDLEINLVREFVKRGGTLVATGESSLYTPEGELRADFGLADVLGVHVHGPVPDRMWGITRTSPMSRLPLPEGGQIGALKGPATDHSYIRVHPECAAAMSGPHKDGERNDRGRRHPILAGFDNTDILAFGGLLYPLMVDTDREVLLTYVPPFPFFPIDKVYAKVERTTVPGLIVGRYGTGRVAFMPADLDRRYGFDAIPDHGKILTNLLRWAIGDDNPVTTTGSGVVSSSLYQQGARLILHLLNHTGADNQSHAIREFFSIGPLRINLQLPTGVKGENVNLLVSKHKPDVVAGVDGTSRRIEFELPHLLDHEVVVIE